MNYSHKKNTVRITSNKLGSASPQIALPRVSVIVTCFNYARYVVQALDSVALQTYENFDCVVIDDASTDDSVSAIERWIGDRNDPRFRLIRNASNSGQTTSFAVGLAATSGEFVAFLDADDLWFPEFLQRHVEAHLNRSFSVSVSCSDLIQIDSEQRMLAGTWVGPRFLDKQAEAVPTVDADHFVRVAPENGGVELFDSQEIRYVYPSYLDHPWTVTSGMVFRRSALDLVMPKGSNELRICTDGYIFVICHYFSGSLAINSALGAYRRHDKNSFGSNPVTGNNLPGAPQAIARFQKSAVGAMLNHLLDDYDRFVALYSDTSVRSLVRILFRKSLRYDVTIQSSRLRRVLGMRLMLVEKVKNKLSFLLRRL